MPETETQKEESKGQEASPEADLEKVDEAAKTAVNAASEEYKGMEEKIAKSREALTEGLSEKRELEAAEIVEAVGEVMKLGTEIFSEEHRTEKTEENLDILSEAALKSAELSLLEEIHLDIGKLKKSVEEVTSTKFFLKLQEGLEEIQAVREEPAARGVIAPELELITLGQEEIRGAVEYINAIAANPDSYNPDLDRGTLERNLNIVLGAATSRAQILERIERERAAPREEVEFEEPKIDEERLRAEVKRITESSEFEELQRRARELRARRQARLEKASTKAEEPADAQGIFGLVKEKVDEGAPPTTEAPPSAISTEQLAKTVRGLGATAESELVKGIRAARERGETIPLEAVLPPKEQAPKNKVDTKQIVKNIAEIRKMRDESPSIIFRLFAENAIMEEEEKLLKVAAAGEPLEAEILRAAREQTELLRSGGQPGIDIKLKDLLPPKEPVKGSLTTRQRMEQWKEAAARAKAAQEEVSEPATKTTKTTVVGRLRKAITEGRGKEEKERKKTPPRRGPLAAPAPV